MQTLKLTKKYEKYPEYKDSGVEWLGMIPKDWKHKKLKSFFSLSNEKVAENPGITTILSVSGYRGVEIRKNVETFDGQMPSENVDTYRIVRKNQLVVNTMWLNFTGLGVSNYEGYVSPAYRSYNISKEIIPEYVNHLMRSNIYVQKYSSLLYGMRPNSLQVKPYDFEKIEILYPSIEEQTKIAKYLDEKTALIDQIIEKKKKQIELIREKRAVVINYAVTKGLDPKVEFVESGVEWIGTIPKNWELKKVKYLAKVIPSNIDKLTVENEETVRLCNYVDVYKNEKITIGLVSNLMVASATANQIKKFTLKKDDVIITKDSEVPDDIGIPTYVPETLVGVVCGYHLAMLRPTHVNGEYLFRYLQSNPTKVQFFMSANGLTRYAISVGDIGNLLVAVPPEEEQVEIQNKLENQIKLNNDVVRHVEISINKLKEFKLSLISNVVTGKIKV